MVKKSSRMIWGRFVCLSLSAVVCLLSWGCGSSADSLRSVQVARPERKALEAVLHATGRVVAPTLDVSAEVAGRISALNVDETANVKAGQVLARIDDAEARGEVIRLRAAVAAARSYQEESLHRLELERARMAKEETSAQAMYEQANWRLAAARRPARAEDISSAEASLDEAQAKLEFARLNRVRLEKLFEQNIASRKALDQALAEERTALAARTRAVQGLEALKAGPRREEVEAVRADVTAAQAQLEFAQDSHPQLALLEQQSRSKELEVERLESELALAEARVTKSTVTAPVDGVVSRVIRRTGELVQPGVPILSVLASEKMWVEVSLSEDEAAHVRPDQVVTVRFPFNPSTSLSGVIADLAPALEGLPGAPGNSRFLKTRIQLQDEPNFLKPGLEAEIESRQLLSKDALQVPRSSVFDSEGMKFVVIVSDGVVRRTAVELGATTSTKAEVIAGISLDDRVVVNQPEDLKDGERVKAVEFGSAR